MYEVIGEYCFDLNRDEYVNDKNEILKIYIKNNLWYAEFQNGANIFAPNEKELVKKIEMFQGGDCAKNNRIYYKCSTSSGGN